MAELLDRVVEDVAEVSAHRFELPPEIEVRTMGDSVRYILPRVAGDFSALRKLMWTGLATAIFLAAAAVLIYLMIEGRLNTFQGVFLCLGLAYGGYYFLIGHIMQLFGSRTTIVVSRRHLRVIERSGIIFTRHTLARKNFRRMAAVLFTRDDNSESLPLRESGLMLFAESWNSALNMGLYPAPVGLALAQHITDRLNAMPAKDQSASIPLLIWHNEVPPDTEQPPVSKATVEQQDDVTSITLRAPVRVGHAVGYAIAGLACIALAIAAYWGIAMTLEDSAFLAVSAVALGIFLLGTFICLAAWMQVSGKPVTVLDITREGLICTRQGLWRTRQHTLARQDVFSVEVVEQDQDTRAAVQLRLTNGRKHKLIYSENKAEMHWIAAVLRDRMRIHTG